MKSTTKRKLGAVGLRGIGFLSYICMPIVVVLNRFVLIKEKSPISTEKAIGIGGILIIIIVLTGFRHKIWPIIKNRFWPYVKKKFHINSIGLLIFWCTCFCILLWIENLIPSIVLWLENMIDTIRDLRTVCISCFTGAAVGQLADMAAGFVEPAKGERDGTVEVSADAEN